MTEQRLPKNYIDPSLSSRDQELLRIFYAACLSEGGSADEVTLRGIRAVIDWQLKQVKERVAAKVAELRQYPACKEDACTLEFYFESILKDLRPQEDN